MGQICGRKVQKGLLIANISLEHFLLRGVPKPQIIWPRKVFWRNVAAEVV